MSSTKASSAIQAIFITVFIVWIILQFRDGIKLTQPVAEKEVIQVKCPTCEECIIAREKYSLYIDSLEYGPRKNRARYEDSARKYGTIVRRK